MNERLTYIFSPSTVISIVSAVVAGAVAWTAHKARVNQLEKDVKELQSYELHIKIAELQKDIQYIREAQNRIEKLLQQK